VAARVRELIADRAQWTGSASDLLQLGINAGGTATAAWTRSAGREIVFGREGRSGTRVIRITAMGESRSHHTVSTVSRASDHEDKAGLNHPPPGLEQAL
jgi:hypothetical protein